mgnify:CR=1 FL=1
MANLTAYQITQEGLKPTFVDADVAGDVLVNKGVEFFYIKNTSASTMTASVTPVVSTVVDPLLGVLAKEVASLELAPNEEGYLGPFETYAFNDPYGKITLQYTDATAVILVALYV